MKSIPQNMCLYLISMFSNFIRSFIYFNLNFYDVSLQGLNWHRINLHWFRYRQGDKQELKCLNIWGTSLLLHIYIYIYIYICPDSKVHGANMGPIWGRQDPGGPHVGPMNFTIWVYISAECNVLILYLKIKINIMQGFTSFNISINHTIAFPFWKQIMQKVISW